MRKIAVFVIVAAALCVANAGAQVPAPARVGPPGEPADKIAPVPEEYQAPEMRLPQNPPLRFPPASSVGLERAAASAKAAAIRERAAREEAEKVIDALLGRNRLVARAEEFSSENARLKEQIAAVEKLALDRSAAFDEQAKALLALQKQNSLLGKNLGRASANSGIYFWLLLVACLISLALLVALIQKTRSSKKTADQAGVLRDKCGVLKETVAKLRMEAEICNSAHIESRRREAQARERLEACRLELEKTKENLREAARALVEYGIDPFTLKKQEPEAAASGQTGHEQLLLLVEPLAPASQEPLPAPQDPEENKA